MTVKNKNKSKLEGKQVVVVAKKKKNKPTTKAAPTATVVVLTEEQQEKLKLKQFRLHMQDNIITSIHEAEVYKTLIRSRFDPGVIAKIEDLLDNGYREMSKVDRDAMFAKHLKQLDPSELANGITLFETKDAADTFMKLSKFQLEASKCFFLTLDNAVGNNPTIATTEVSINHFDFSKQHQQNNSITSRIDSGSKMGQDTSGRFGRLLGASEAQQLPSQLLTSLEELKV